MKSPFHPVPSGDRRVGRLYLEALRQAGHRCEVVSDLRTHLQEPTPARLADRRRQAAIEVARLSDEFDRGARQRPDLWFTYHLYYKAPDWIGPPVCQALGIAYVVAEASYAPKRAGGPWDAGHRATREALMMADAVLSPTKLDMACVQPLLAPGACHTLVPPFLDPTSLAAAAGQRKLHRQHVGRTLDLRGDRPRLLAVAMMRDGAKLESYRLLAHALGLIADRPWDLIVVGDGPAAPQVRDAFAALGPRVRWVGAVPELELPAYYASSDIYVWPAVHEAYGMAILEAQAAGLPAVLGDVRGVPDVVERDRTALLVPEGNVQDLAGAMRRLLDDEPRRREMGRAALEFVANHRTITAAARAIDRVLAEAVLAHRDRHAP